MSRIQNYRKGNEVCQRELWNANDLAAHLHCDKTKAEALMKECRQKNNLIGYCDIEKNLLLDFIEQKQRAEREREARHQADIATAESFAVLKEQVSTLKEIVAEQRRKIELLDKMATSSSREAKSARRIAILAAILGAVATLASPFVSYLITRLCHHCCL